MSRQPVNMARSKVLLSVVACAWHIHGANARDGDGQEYFPLSGGVSNGVRVTVKAESLSGPGLTQLDFLTPDRTVALRWDMNIAGNSINRSSDITGFSEVLGKPNVNANEALSLMFYKTSESWQVSMSTDGASPVRLPWFDFTLQSNDLMTHLSVYDGFVNAEVVQDRPTCETVCHPSECMAACENMTCYSTTPSLECSSAQQTGKTTDPNRVCCDGTERPAKDMSPDQWVSLAEETLLTPACNAFLPAFDCAPFAAQKGQIKSCDDEAKTCQVYVPAAQEEDSPAAGTIPPEAVLTLPMYGLVAKAPFMEKSIIVPGAETKPLWGAGWASGEFRVDLHTGLIWSATAATAMKYQLKRGWFISMIRYDPGEWYGERWFQYSGDIVERLQFGDRGKVGIYLTDEPVADVPACGASFYPDPFPRVPQRAGGEWHDNQGNTCDVYQTQQWCTRHGEPTQAWCDVFKPGDTGCNSNTLMATGCPINRESGFRCLDPDGFEVVSSADFECCQCGGGASSAPQGWMEPGMMFFQ